jgi:hypothetical protein
MDEKIGGLIGVVLVSVFVIGLAWSISTGFAGFWGGLPFWCIIIPILSLVIYDYWRGAFREQKKD